MPALAPRTQQRRRAIAANGSVFSMLQEAVGCQCSLTFQSRLKDSVGRGWWVPPSEEETRQPVAKGCDGRLQRLPAGAGAVAVAVAVASGSLAWPATKGKAVFPSQPSSLLKDAWQAGGRSCGQCLTP